MTDYSELKRLAEAAKYVAGPIFDVDGPSELCQLAEYVAANHAAVLALIADLEDMRLRRDSFRNSCSEWAAKTDWARPFKPDELGQHIGDVIRARFDKLKAENESLTRIEAGLREMLHRQNKEINRLKKAAR